MPDSCAGAGVIPWTRDRDRLEEDFFLAMAAPVDGDAPVEGARAISVPGTRILARRLSDAVDHQRALTRRLTDHSCPLDLHRRRPVPEPILRLGPDEPAAQAWLRSHRGTPRPLRHVRALPAQGDRRQTSQMRVEFWSADWSPWQALRRLRQAWPMLWTSGRTMQPTAIDSHG